MFPFSLKICVLKMKYSRILHLHNLRINHKRTLFHKRISPEAHIPNRFAQIVLLNTKGVQLFLILLRLEFIMELVVLKALIELVLLLVLAT